MNKALRFACVAVLALGALAAPAQASTIPGADFAPGSTLGAGYEGLSYDHAWGDWDLGASVGDSSFLNYGSHMKLGARAARRFLTIPGIAADVLGGVTYDPGNPGSRAYLLPDIGVGVAYSFGGVTPLVLRLNVTVTIDQYQAPDPQGLEPRGNLLQRLTFGPNSMIGLGLQVSKNLELTLGGGTLAGMQLKF